MIESGLIASNFLSSKFLAMSLELKVNSTVSKLTEKYENTSWNELATKVLNDQHFKKTLSTLMENHSKGISFQPGFNQIFSVFDNDLSTIQVIVVYPDALEELPAYASRDNVTIVRSPLTHSKGVDNDSLWESFVRQLLKEIAYRTIKTIFLFVGDETEKYKSVVGKGHYKFFVPKEPEFEMSKVYDNINDLLKKIDREPINW